MRAAAAELYHVYAARRASSAYLRIACDIRIFAFVSSEWRPPKRRLVCAARRSALQVLPVLARDIAFLHSSEITRPLNLALFAARPSGLREYAIRASTPIWRDDGDTFFLPSFRFCLTTGSVKASLTARPVRSLSPGCAYLSFAEVDCFALVSSRCL